MKVVINGDYGGFVLSNQAIRRLFELKGWKCVEEITKYDYTLFYKDYKAEDSLFTETNLKRNDAELVRVVEELGEAASGKFSSLKVVEIPEDVKWHISEYGGLEHVAEDHRTWY